MPQIRVPYNYRQGHLPSTTPKLPVFVGVRGGQRGGGFLGSVFRTLTRYAVPALKFLLPSARNVARDYIRGRSVKESLKEHGRRVLVGAVHKGVDHAAEAIKRRATSRFGRQEGSGIKRKRSQSRAKTGKRRKKTTKKSKKQTGAGAKRASKKKKTPKKRKQTSKKKKQTGGRLLF